MSTPTISTRSVWLASYFLSRGLAFVRATRLSGAAFRASFVFQDPDGVAPRLTEDFLQDVPLQRVIGET